MKSSTGIQRSGEGPDTVVAASASQPEAPMRTLRYVPCPRMPPRPRDAPVPEALAEPAGFEESVPLMG
ncbi:hypothetical protein GCM10023238_21360 [Streptomyces heliomycini]